MPRAEKRADEEERSGVKSVGLNGERGLLVAIIYSAHKDARRGRADAIQFFRSEWYREILGWLGLPETFLPEMPEGYQL